MQILGSRFGRRHRESALQLSDHRADDGALLLQRTHVTEQQVEFQPADPHAGAQGVGAAVGCCPISSSRSAVCRVSCHESCCGLNSIGNFKSLPVACGPPGFMVTLAITLPGWSAAHVRSVASKVNGAYPLS